MKKMFHLQKCQTLASLSSPVSLKHSIVLLKWFIIMSGPWLSFQKLPLLKPVFLLKLFFSLVLRAETLNENKRSTNETEVFYPQQPLYELPMDVKSPGHI